MYAINSNLLTCQEKESLAKQICTSDGTCKHWVSVAPHASRAEILDITETLPRSWFFVVSNCDGKVDVTYTVSSDNAVSCASLRPTYSGQIIATVFMTLVAATLVATTIRYYRLSERPAVKTARYDRGTASGSYGSVSGSTSATAQDQLDTL